MAKFLVMSKVVAFTKMLRSEIGTGLSTKNSSGNAKVPNPAKHFGIMLWKSILLYEMNEVCALKQPYCLDRRINT